MFDAAPIDAEMVASASYFYRDDDILLDDDGPFVMQYGTTVSVAGTFDDLPSSRDVGTYPTSDPRIKTFGVTVGGNTASSAQLTVTKAAPTRVVGEFLVGGGSGETTNLLCTFDLRRAYEHDTDD